MHPLSVIKGHNELFWIRCFIEDQKICQKLHGTNFDCFTPGFKISKIYVTTFLIQCYKVHIINKY